MKTQTLHADTDIVFGQALYSGTDTTCGQRHYLRAQTLRADTDTTCGHTLRADTDITFGHRHYVRIQTLHADTRHYHQNLLLHGKTKDSAMITRK
jgi:hypothetical protein